MKYNIKLELIPPGNTEPVAAEAEHLDQKSISRLAESIRRKAAGSGEEEKMNQVLEHLSGIDPEWTLDFLNSI